MSKNSKPLAIISDVFGIISFLVFVLPIVYYGKIATDLPDFDTAKIFAWIAIGSCILSFVFLGLEKDPGKKDHKWAGASIIPGIAGIIYLIA